MMSGAETGAHADRLAYIALGSNLDSQYGRPAETLRAAAGLLGGLGHVEAASSLYETDPVGYRDQPPFVNAVVALKTRLEPEELLRGLLAIERRFGRERGQAAPKGPRTLDLDLLLMDGAALHTDALTLPHPSLAARRFVLAPLAEIAPGERHPVLGLTMAELLAALPDEGENRIASVRRAEPLLRT